MIISPVLGVSPLPTTGVQVPIQMKCYENRTSELQKLLQNSIDTAQRLLVFNACPPDKGDTVSMFDSITFWTILHAKCSVIAHVNSGVQAMRIRVND